MKELFLMCALALPCLPTTDAKDENYATLVEFIEKHSPGRTVALINPDEVLMGNVEWTPMYFRELRIWVVPKTRHLRLVKAKGAA